VARHALVVGGTGLVGTCVVDALLADATWSRVTALARRPLRRPGRKFESRVVDFAHLEQLSLPAIDDVFCCLGTTIRVAGSRAAFRRVDHDYPLAVAKAALAAGAEQFLFISAMGADPRAAVFYSRVKGELEHDAATLPFRAVIALRPSLLAGVRTGYRPGERLALAILQPLRRLVPRNYRPVAATAVARAMVDCAKRDLRGFAVVESGALLALAGDTGTAS
jgi:uncharacterized protein YbjT (DUF2867 family)